MGPWKRHKLRPGWHFRILGGGRTLVIKDPGRGWCRQWFVGIQEADGTCGPNTHSDVQPGGKALTERSAKRWATKWVMAHLE